MILLSEDKLNELYDEFAEQSEEPNWEIFLLKKQLKRVVGWQNELCEEHDHGGAVVSRRRCWLCHESLMKEAGL